MNSHRLKLIAAALFLLIAGVVAWRSLWVSRPATIVQRMAEETDDAVAIRSVRFADVGEFGGPDAFASTIRAKIETAATASDIPPASARSLAEYVSSRVRMLLDSDYDAYAADIERLFGGPASSIGIEYMADRAKWGLISAKFSSAPVSPDVVYVRSWVDEGDNPRGTPGGAYTFMSTPKPFRDLVGARRVDVVDVYVPMRVEEVDVPQVGSGGRTHDCFIVLSFAWDARRARWVPWRSGVFEPAGESKVMPYPWI